MEADVNAGEIDTIIVSNISRIARDIILCRNWISKMDEKGVKVIAVDDSHILQAPERDFLSGMLTKFMRRQRRTGKCKSKT